MKEEEYHLGLGYSDCAYVGTFREPNDGINFIWKKKHEININEVLVAAAEYLIDKDSSMFFEYEGNKYCLLVEKQTEEEEK